MDPSVGTNESKSEGCEDGRPVAVGRTAFGFLHALGRLIWLLLRLISKPLKPQGNAQERTPGIGSHIGSYQPACGAP